MYIWYINICTVVTLYSIKMVYKEERKFYEERKIRLPPWIHSDFGRSEAEASWRPYGKWQRKKRSVLKLQWDRSR